MSIRRDVIVAHGETLALEIVALGPDGAPIPNPSSASVTVTIGAEDGTGAALIEAPATLADAASATWQASVPAAQIAGLTEGGAYRIEAWLDIGSDRYRLVWGRLTVAPSVPPT